MWGMTGTTLTAVEQQNAYATLRDMYDNYKVNFSVFFWLFFCLFFFYKKVLNARMRYILKEFNFFKLG